jgi:hypothetical protein
MPTARSVTREVIAALGVVLLAATGTWLAASVRWVSSELRWGFVGFSVFMYGQALFHFAFSRHLKRLRRRLGLSGFQIFRLMCAVQLLAGGSFMVGALTLLVKANTAERRVLVVIAALGALGWILLWGWYLRGLWGKEDQPDAFDTA